MSKTGVRIGVGTDMDRVRDREGIVGTAVVRSADSVTLVHETTADTPAWRAMEVAGSFAFSETGILAALAEPLAAAGVSLFAVNSFETDFVLVQEADLERAAAAVSAAGHSLG